MELSHLLVGNIGPRYPLQGTILWYSVAVMKSFYITALIVFAGAFCPRNVFPRPLPKAASVRKPQRESRKSDSQTDSEQRGSEDSPFVVKILGVGQAQNEPQTHGSEGRKYSEGSWGLSDEIATVATIVGFLQFLALVGTIWAMSWYNRRQLRAYVLPDNGGIMDGSSLDPPQPQRKNVPGVVIVIKNSGQTPAHNVISWFQISVVPVQDEHRALGLPAIENRFSNNLGSGSVFTKAAWFDRSLTPSEITDLNQGTRAIYVYGRIEYKDIFKRPHFSNFRLHYTGKFPPAPNATLNFSEKGNEAN